MTETTLTQFTESLLQHVSEISDPSIPQEERERHGIKNNKSFELG